MGCHNCCSCSVQRALCLGVILVAICSGGVLANQDQPEIYGENSVRGTLPSGPSNKVGGGGRAGGRGDTEPDLTPSIDNLLEEAVLPAHGLPEDTDDGSCSKGTYLTELDMCLTREQIQAFQPVVKDAGGQRSSRQKRQSPLLAFGLWPGAVVPYLFNHSFPASDRRLVLSAMSEWERVTCIRFRPATSEDRDIVIFRDGHRCSTNIGRVGGPQLLTLAQPCRRKRILIHELGHVLGLIHEHQRHDRDHYVRVLLQNVRNSSQERYQFAKLGPRPLTDGQVEYSYTSIMHYGRNYFAKSPELTTLQTIDPHFQNTIGRAEVPAFSDAETVNVMYGCAAMSQFQNRLPDATCDFFQRTGECEGSIKDTIRPLCPRSCHLQAQRQAVHRFTPQPTRQISIFPHTGPHTAQLKTHAPLFGQANNEIGQLGGLIADSLVSPPSPAHSLPLHQPPPQPSPWSPSRSTKQTANFGTPPFTAATGRAFTLTSQQLQLQQQIQQRRQQLQQQSAAAALKHFVITKPSPSVQTLPHNPSVASLGSNNNNQMPSWMRPRQPHNSRKSTSDWRSKPPSTSTTTTLLPQADFGAGFLAASNMKAFSPEALPETPVGPDPALDLYRTLHGFNAYQHGRGGGGGGGSTLMRALGVATGHWSGQGMEGGSGWAGPQYNPSPANGDPSGNNNGQEAHSQNNNDHQQQQQQQQHESPEHPEVGVGNRRGGAYHPGPVMHHVTHLGPDPHMGLPITFRML